LSICGCKKNEQQSTPPPPPPAAAKAPLPVQKQPTSAKVVGQVETSLDFSTKKDPFKPAVEPVQQQQKEKPTVSARSGGYLPIQKYDVNKYQVSGIIIGFKENTALVVDPDGKGYVVKEGMPIGNNDGRITRILPSAILVVEPHRDENGRMKKRTITLALSKKS